MGDKSGAFNLALPHRKNLVAQIENLEAGVSAFIESTKLFRLAMEQADAIPLAPENARALFADALGSEDGGKLSPRAMNTVGRLVALYRGGAGNRGETLLDGISAVTDFYSHESSAGEDKSGFRMKQFLSSEFGSGNKAKRDFIGNLFTLADGGATFKRDSFLASVMRGNAILARSEAVSVN
jgi:hypothetical protein